MNAQRRNVGPTRHWDRETALVAQFAACVSFISFAFYFQHGSLLLYGDAVAHINIARRVFDSRTPGLLQLGTVWLPLPHLLMIPFLLSESAWQSGISGAIPSMVAYALGAAGIFRLVRGALSRDSEPDLGARVAAWLSAIIYAANPNLIYLQTTAMTESLYLALFVWAVVYFSEFVREESWDKSASGAVSSSLMKCGLCLVAACLTRYDGWLLAAAMCAAAVAVVLKSKRNDPALRRSFAKFVLLAATAPALWLAYNAIIYRNPLEFANGPYSARAIERKSASPGTPAHPGSHDLPVAFSYVLKSGELNMAAGTGQKLWVLLLLAGTAMILILDTRLWPLLLLAAPLPFYMLSVAYGGVPIFVPAWWPFSFYNVRYGLQLLPGFSAAAAITTYSLLRVARNKSAKTAVVSVQLILLAASYASVWRAQPVCFREAWVNSRTRIALETELASNLKKLPRDAALLMFLGDHVGALQQAGIPLRQTINEGNHRPWKTPADSEGLWERALANPAQYVDFVVALDGDPVAAGAQKQGLFSLAVIRTAGQPSATIYWTHHPAR
jgi:Alg9-like mannosyltransferase family